MSAESPFALVERMANGKRLVHANGASGDSRTLCGYAYEGNPGTEDGELRFSSHWGINCKSCALIILHCKAIPMTRVASKTKARLRAALKDERK